MKLPLYLANLGTPIRSRETSQSWVAAKTSFKMSSAILRGSDWAVYIIIRSENLLSRFAPDVFGEPPKPTMVTQPARGE